MIVWPIELDKQVVLFLFLFVSKNLQNGFAADVHNLLEETQTLPVSRNVVASCRTVSFGKSLLGSLRTGNPLATAANDFHSMK
jgi:hypothetical protein